MKMKLLLGVVIGILNVVDANRTLQEAVLYKTKGQEGSGVLFTQNPDWSDLTAVLDHAGLDYLGSVCVTGAWIMYRLPYFESTGTQDFSILSGNNNCLVPGNIESMQPLGSADSPFSPSVSFFTEKYFGGEAHPASNHRGRRFFENLLSPVQSLIIVGESQWTVQDTNNNHFCMLTNFDQMETIPICMLPDVSETLFAKGLEISNFSKGCKVAPNPDYLITIEDCAYFGYKEPADDETYRPRVLSKNLLMNQTGEWMKGRGSVTETYKGIGPQQSCSNNKPSAALEEFIILTSIRLKHDFGSSEQLLWPQRREDIWKTEILDLTWEIGMMVLPKAIIPLPYLQIMREFMVYHLNVYWQRQGLNIKVDIPERFLRNLRGDLQKCMVLVQESIGTIMDTHMKSWANLEKEVLLKGFKRLPEFDIVIDTNWLVANMVMATCHHLTGYSTNFWANFIHTFNAMYLTPLTPFWGSMRVEDEYILGGFDYESQYARIALFATNMFESTPNLIPFTRPPSLNSLLHS